MRAAEMAVVWFTWMTSAVKLLQHQIKHFSRYFGPVNSFPYTENNYFSGWANRHFGFKSFARYQHALTQFEHAVNLGIVVTTLHCEGYSCNNVLLDYRRCLTKGLLFLPTVCHWTQQQYTSFLIGRHCTTCLRYLPSFEWHNTALALFPTVSHYCAPYCTYALKRSVHLHATMLSTNSNNLWFYACTWKAPAASKPYQVFSDTNLHGTTGGQWSCFQIRMYIIFRGYFDPENVNFDSQNNLFSGWSD